jgi:hypothetical protein
MVGALAAGGAFAGGGAFAVDAPQPIVLLLF